MVKRVPGQGTRIASVVFFGLIGLALACKYSVRDVGFVDLAEDQYGVYLFLSDAAKPSMSRDAKTIATATFLESNLSLQVAHLGEEPEHPSLWMTNELEIKSFPAALLRSPDGRSLRLPLAGSNAGAVTEDDLWNLMESTVSSAKREQLLSLVLDAFAVVVLLESNDSEQNAAASTAIDGAIDSIKELMPRMPKPVDTPPIVLTVSTEERDAEAIMLWSLGFDLDLTDEPQAAIVIGRGRRLGPPLQGGLITRTKMQQMMALIGQDCECDLDRSWMQGPMVPLRWDSDQQRLAYDKLAFDAENPLVKAEISRILARGPNARGETAGKSDVSMDALFLGYSEERVDTAVSETSASAVSASMDAEEPAPVPSVEPTEAGESLATFEPLEVQPPAEKTNPDSEEGPEGGNPAIPLTLLVVLGLGCVALIGGAIVIVRGAGV